MIATWPRREKKGVKRRWVVQSVLLCLLPLVQVISSVPFFLVWSSISLIGLFLRRFVTHVSKLPFVPFCLLLWGLQFFSFCILSDLAHIHTKSVAAISSRHADQLLDKLTQVLGHDRVRRISKYLDRNRPASSGKVEMMTGLQELMNITWSEQLATADDKAALSLWKEAGLKPKGTSVVIAAYEEHKYIQRTIDSVLKETPLLGLAEILIVDDFNNPPLTSALNQDTLAHPLVKVIRNAKHVGLIQSKQIGGDAARGDYIVFLDGHVKPYARWLVHMRREGLTNWRRIVVPAIPILDGETWQQEGAAVGYKMMFDWDLTFNWFEDDNDEVPCMSGGLLGLTKEWWDYTKGLDSGMEVWGGENVEQSIRTWLSGGEIVVARDARIPHVFRSTFPYHVDSKKVAMNKVRTVDVWFDAWKDKVWKTANFAHYRKQLSSHALDDRRKLRKEIAIYDFDWYVRRFRNAFVAKKLIETLQFRIKTPSGLCLLSDGRALITAACDDDEKLNWHIWGQDMHPQYPPEVGELDDGSAISFNPMFVPMSAVGHSRHYLILRHASSEKCLLPAAHPRGLMRTDYVDTAVVTGECVRSTARGRSRDWNVLYSYNLENVGYRDLLNREDESVDVSAAQLEGRLRWGSMCLTELPDKKGIVSVLCANPELKEQMFVFESFSKHL